ncbi:MAG: hypothetical protein HY821_26015 [Acidobacteria bacterium]|nr:hypothetical protein [Acidobacteriota bacterium]
MTQFTLKLTSKEVELLAGLAADQLFRREFIDPKMPGYRADLAHGKVLVERLRALLDPRQALKTERLSSNKRLGAAR